MRIAEYLKYIFAETEQRENAMELARKTKSLAELELKKKSVAAAIKAEIDECTGEIARYSWYVTDGYDFRMVQCDVLYHVPSKGNKTIVRCDTGEEVRVESMNSVELQQNLFPEEEAESVAGD